MARTKTSPETAPSAAHPAPDPSPAPGTAPAAVSPAAAVHAALAANPGSAVAVIADAAGTGKPAARDALLAMEKGGTATRVKGGKPGIPDTWTLAGRRRTTPARKTSRPASPATAPPAARTVPATTRRPARPARTGLPRPPAPDSKTLTPRTAPTQRAGTATSAANPRDAGELETSRGRRDRRRHSRARRQDTDGEAGDAPDPALVSEIIERTGQIKAAADAAEQVLTASGDLKTALAGMDEIYEQAAQARRSLKAATGGRKAPAARPGGLRDKVLAHLDAHPDKEFTPHEIHKVINHSSGAIANALDTLVKHGDAEVATDKPRRFRRAAQPAGAAPEADSAEQDGTELAGAA